MIVRFGYKGGAALFAAAVLLGGCERPSVEAIQSGYRGTGMQQIVNRAGDAAKHEQNLIPETIPAADKNGPLAKEELKGVQVLGDLSVAQFGRVMAAMTAWVSPKEGCNYCHVQGDYTSDAKYTKVVSRQMLKMTLHLNNKWKNHVGETGVTCYTCHRGQPVPSNVWFNSPASSHDHAYAGRKAGQNTPAAAVNYSSLPFDPFTSFFEQANSIRVATKAALPVDNKTSIQQTEWTYGLMTHMSQGLGVNCTFCHNSRAFSDWSQSPIQRTTAWHGIRLVRDINNNYLHRLQHQFPPYRLGQLGDIPKVNCTTCHQGVSKPLYGVSMLKDYPELLGVSSETATP